MICQGNQCNQCNVIFEISDIIQLWPFTACDTIQLMTFHKVDTVIYQPGGSDVHRSQRLR